MNALTRNFLEYNEHFRMFYSSNKEELDNVKCFSAMIPMLLEMLEMCNTEFVRSVAYVNESKKESKRKRQEIEIIANRIKMAVHDYYHDHHLNSKWDKKAVLSVSTVNLSPNELLHFSEVLKEITEPIHGKLLKYGITGSLLKNFHELVHNSIPAMPLNIEEIETHKRRYRSVVKSIKEIEMYLEFK